MVGRSGLRSGTQAWRISDGRMAKPFSLGFSQIKDVRDYIAEQEAHHRKATFQEEFRALLRRFEIALDERYVWD